MKFYTGESEKLDIPDLISSKPIKIFKKTSPENMSKNNGK